MLFSGTIADNLRYGRLDATDGGDRGGGARGARARVHRRACRRATTREIAEAGGGLSGGERQRLSVARAILKNAPILILDEPTSSLDAISEEIVFAALRRLRAGRTTIVIAHRLSTVRDADRILVLDGGRIAAQGRHDELLKSSQLYRRMCARLSVGKSLDDPETRRRADRGGEAMRIRAIRCDPVRRHHRPLSVRRRHLVLADVPARAARARARGLLHRGHRRVRLRPGAEHARRPIRPTAPPTSTTRSSRSASAIAGRSSTTTAATTAAAPTTSGATAADADLFINLSGGSWFWRDEYARIPRKVVHRLRPGVHAARHREGRAVVRRVLPALRSPVHVRREHRHAGVADSDRRLHLAQDLAAGHARRLGARRARRAIASRP